MLYISPFSFCATLCCIKSSEGCGCGATKCKNIKKRSNQPSQVIRGLQHLLCLFRRVAMPQSVYDVQRRVQSGTAGLAGLGAVSGGRETGKSYSRQ